MHRLLKHKVLVGLVALLVVGSAGGAYAATQSETTSRQALLNDVAGRLNVSPARLRAAIQGALQDRIAAAVKAGQLTQAQANALNQRIQQGGLPFKAFGPAGPWLGGFGRSHRGFGPPGLIGPGGPGMMIAPGGPGMMRPFGAAADYLGLSETQLFKDLRSGKTLAQIATAQNKSVSGLEQALVSAQRSRLDKLVAAGWLTKAQEQQTLSRLSDRIAQLVTHAHIRLGSESKQEGGPAAVVPLPPPEGAAVAPPAGPPPFPGA